ncbi:Bromodomain-containing protein [Taphrina deformans PYCC 5710]|uniref:Bromodomain-containing protein n=1 Tax=Taphrina deformans (strain PYCC 5710 / ATCC 11124 / CBS 356.35 / IMI 108563 / JCM 9778 / NBRC 8474) TaxID=1097556 RepID=R4X8B1_TAPDE|nr:Bromodomain-containing protein [Taphrina deformans PYCC 5710]|eukprot:CCG81799.1 Bromodomain-containing protein [Taphrina deformans PYCC 5710]
MTDLQEVLLVQLVRKYGTEDYGTIASALQQHPLLTSDDTVKSDWTKDSCRSRFGLIQTREFPNMKVDSSSTADSAIDKIWTLIYHRYLQYLKTSIKADEEQYKALRIASPAPDAEESATSLEVPSSTQETINDERSSRSDNTSRSLRAIPPQKSSLEVRTKERKHQNLSIETPSDQSNNTVAVDEQDSAVNEGNSTQNVAMERGVTSGSREETSQIPSENVEEVTSVAVEKELQARNQAIEQDQRPIVESKGSSRNDEALIADDDLSSANDDNDPPLHDTEKFSEDGKDEEMSGADADTPGALDTTVDEIAVAFSVNEQSHAPDSQSTPPSMTLRKSRTRSSTMNTVMSTDVTTKDDVEADNVLKRGSGRNNKRNAARESETTRSSRVGSPMDDSESAATQKRFQSTILPVLANIASHRYASIFANPVSNREAPNYSKVVRSPTDLKTIRAQVKNGEIGTAASFHRSVLMMLSNAIMYNPENSEVAAMAQDLFVHVEVSFSYLRRLAWS